MTLVCPALTALVVLSWVYWALTLIAAWRFRRFATAADVLQPAATILKPLCGMDHELRENLRSFLIQDYPAYQVVFVADEDNDPALDVARSLIVEHASVDAVAVSGGGHSGANRKVANLVHGMALAKHNLIVVCDSDMRVAPDYLRSIAAELADPSVGVVTCLYRGTETHSMAARLEALHIGADFVPGVLAAWLLMGARFGFGSTLAVRREALHRIGGFETLLDELADDYRLVEKVRQIGFRSLLSNYVVSCVLGRAGLAEMLVRRLRWARTIRHLQPWGHLGSLITYGVPLACLLTMICPVASFRWLAAATVVMRLAFAPAVAMAGARDREVLRNLILLLPNDWIGFAIWLWSWTGSSVRWRGRTLTIK